MGSCHNCGKKIKSDAKLCAECREYLRKKYSEESKKKRPVFLSIVLGVMAIGSFLSLSIILIIPLLLPFVILSIVATWALYNWKKWGLDLYIFNVIAGFFVSVLTDPTQEDAFITLIAGGLSVLILYAAMRPIWNKFE